MIGPKYIERNPNAEKYKERCMELHAQRLKEISAKKAFRKSQDDLIVPGKLNQEKKRTQEFLEQERKLHINKDNQKLLSKLFEISHGKWSSVTFQDKEAARPRSLNIGMRKKESERIEKENKAFARRLFEKNASLSIKKLENDFNAHEKYKKQVQRTFASKKTSKHQGRVNHLPPMTSETKPSKRASLGAMPINEEDKVFDEHKNVLSSDTSPNNDVSMSQLSKQMDIKPIDIVKKNSTIESETKKEETEQEKKERADRINGKFVIKKMPDAVRQSDDKSENKEAKQDTEVKRKETEKEVKKKEAEKEIKRKETEKQEHKQAEVVSETNTENDTKKKLSESRTTSKSPDLIKRKSETSSPYGKINKEDVIHKSQTTHIKKEGGSAMGSPEPLKKRKSVDHSSELAIHKEANQKDNNQKEASPPKILTKPEKSEVDDLEDFKSNRKFSEISVEDMASNIDSEA